MFVRCIHIIVFIVHPPSWLYGILLNAYNHILLTQPPSDRHLGRFPSGTVMNSAAVNILLHVCGEYIYMFLLGMYTEVGLLGCRVNVCSTFVDIARCIIIFNGEATWDSIVFMHHIYLFM